MRVETADLAQRMHENSTAEIARSCIEKLRGIRQLEGASNRYPGCWYTGRSVSLTPCRSDSVHQIAEEFYPQVARLNHVKGVGPRDCVDRRFDPGRPAPASAQPVGDMPGAG